MRARSLFVVLAALVPGLGACGILGPDDSLYFDQERTFVHEIPDCTPFEEMGCSGFARFDTGGAVDYLWPGDDILHRNEYYIIRRTVIIGGRSEFLISPDGASLTDGHGRKWRAVP